MPGKLFCALSLIGLLSGCTSPQSIDDQFLTDSGPDTHRGPSPTSGNTFDASADAHKTSDADAGDAAADVVRDGAMSGGDARAPSDSGNPASDARVDSSPSGGEAGADGSVATSPDSSVADTGVAMDSSPVRVDAGACDPPALGPLYGWAAVTSLGVSGTTGGGNATPVVVTTAADFNTFAGGTTPEVIYVRGTITSNALSIGSNKTIVGLCGAALHGHVEMSGSVNVILRNLTIVGNNCTDSPGACLNGADAVTIINHAHHLWLDHDDISDGSDGNLDITHACDYITVSWTKFSYSTTRTDATSGADGHRYSNLIGHDDANGTEDEGHFLITMHHNWWANNVFSNMARVRFGYVHFYNNLFTASGDGSCTFAGFHSRLLVENNLYKGVNNPLVISGGDMESKGNVFDGVTGSRTDTGVSFVPLYTYTLDATTNLMATVEGGAGPQ